MTSRISSGFLTILAASFLWGASPAVAQSVFSTQGLGFPSDPMDGRSMGLGGVALGQPEPEISWANPASAIGFIAPGLSLSYQFDDYTASTPDTTFEGSTARFPMIIALIPAGERFKIMGGFGSFLDQTWRLQKSGTLVFGSDTIETLDLITSEGGVTRMRLGGAYYIGGGFGIGLAADFLRGAVEREEGRIFGPASGLGDTFVQSRWRYRGTGYTAGAHWSPGLQGGLGIAVSYGGTLNAENLAEGGEDRSYTLPVTVQFGATGRVMPNLLLAAGGKWSGWSGVDGELLVPETAHDSWSAQAGLEWDAISLRERPIPLRLGVRTGALPFSEEDAGEAVSERAMTMGMGLLIAGGAVRPDLAVEFGNRSGGSSLEESYWRVGASIRVLGR